MKSIVSKKKKKVRHTTENCPVRDCNLCEIIREGRRRHTSSSWRIYGIVNHGY